jgi:hypothetical protein
LAEEKKQTGNQSSDVCVAVNPGVCGFACTIQARKLDAQTVSLEITGSECKQIQKLSEHLVQITMMEFFTPISQNPVYLSAEKCGCHLPCIVPAAVLKTVEATLGLALPRDVRIQFVPCK